MTLSEKLKSRNIKVTKIPKWGEYLRKVWENNFANHLSDEEKKRIHLFATSESSGYLWHIFSYKEKGCLENEEAEAAFNAVDKKDCYIFYQHSDDVVIIGDAANLSAYDLRDEMDIYVANKEFNWTYVITHEEVVCGPYFSWANKKI